MQDTFWTQHILGPTHIDRKCLAIVGSSKENSVARVKSVGRISDYNLQGIELFSSVSENESQEEVLDWAKLDSIGLRADAKATICEGILSRKDPDASWKSFRTKVEELIS